MATLNNFNAHDVDPMNEFEAIPAGKYLAIITNSEMKTTKAGDGQYLKLTFQVIEGEYKGRNLWSQLNLNNPSPKAVEIAQAKLSSICRAVGVMTPNDSVDLHNLPLLITVRCKKWEETGDNVNEIRGYAKKESAVTEEKQNTDKDPPWKQNSSRNQCAQFA